MRDTGVEQGPQLLQAPLVERETEAGTQAIAGQVQPQSLVLGRPAPRACAQPQGVEQPAQHRRAPAGALAQHLLELRAQLPDFLDRHLLRLRAEDPLHPRQRRRQPRHHAVVVIVRGGVVVLAQVELQQPALGRVVDADTMHFERADFGQRAGQLHRHFAARALRAWRRGRAQHHGDRRQARIVAAVEVDQLTEREWRLSGRIGARGKQVKADRLAHTQREVVCVEAQFLPRFAAARQDADGAPRAAFALLPQQQEVAAGGATADLWGAALSRQRIGDRPAGDGHIRVIVVQHAQRGAAPLAQCLFESPRQRIGAKHAAVEQQGIGHRRHIGSAARSGAHGIGVAPQEIGDVARDGGVARIRQAEFDDAGAPL